MDIHPQAWKKYNGLNNSDLKLSLERNHANGTVDIKVMTVENRNACNIIQYDFSKPVDLSGKKFLSLEFQGTNSGICYHLVIDTVGKDGENSFSYKWTDSSTKRRRLIFALDHPDEKTGRPNSGRAIRLRLLSTQKKAPEFFKVGKLAISTVNLCVSARNMSVRLKTVAKSRILVTAGWRAAWIWAGRDDSVTEDIVYFRKTLFIPFPVAGGKIQITAQDYFWLYINGRLVYSATGRGLYKVVKKIDIGKYLKPGKNIIAVKAQSVSEASGMILEGIVNGTGNEEMEIISDVSWRVKRAGDLSGWNTAEFVDRDWLAPKILGIPPVAPWGLPVGHKNYFRKRNVSINKLKLSKSVFQSGETANFSVSVTLNEPLEKNYALFAEILRDGVTYKVQNYAPVPPTAEWLIKKESVQGPFFIKIPPGLPAGKYDLRVGLYNGSAEAETPLTVKGAALPEKADARLGAINKRPVFIVNKKPGYCMAYRPGNRWISSGFAAPFADSSIHVYTFLYSSYWHGPDKYDASALNKLLDQIICADPVAQIIIHVDLNVYGWWLRNNPAEICKFEGSRQGGAHQSLASRKWRRDAGNALRAIIRHVNATGYRRHVIGYHLSAGITEEWQSWGCHDGAFGDYGIPMQNTFRQYIKNKYHNEAVLKRRWNDPSATFAAVRVPDMARRNKCGKVFFRDMKTEMDIIDYYQFYSEVNADAIQYFSRIVKKETAGAALCGVYYGYLFEHRHMALQHGGHLSLRKVLKNPDIDYIAAPVTYKFRKPGDTGGFMVPVNSVIANGKMFFQENDIRTFLADPKQPISKVGRCSSIRESIGVIERDFALPFINGGTMWWFDMRGGWFADDKVMSLLKHMNGILSSNLRIRDLYDPQNALAVIVDELSPSYYKVGGPYSTVLSDLRTQLAKSGVAYRLYLFSDLIHARLPEHRCYLFVNTFYMNKAERNYIDKNLKKAGNMLVWLYAPGIIAESGLSAKNMKSLTGINIEEEKGVCSPEIRLTENAGTILKGVRSKVWGLKTSMTPAFWVADHAATILGKFRDSGKAGFCLKEQNNWFSVYCASPVLPADLIRALANKAGIHVFSSDEDSLQANKKYIMIHALKTGEKKIKLPVPSRVYDIFNARNSGNTVTEINVRVPKGETRLFFYGTVKELNRLLYSAGNYGF
ncbi:MAG: hypothetical protein WC082_00765 [Victivallales bacterium]